MSGCSSSALRAVATSAPRRSVARSVGLSVKAHRWPPRRSARALGRPSRRGSSLWPGAASSARATTASRCRPRTAGHHLQLRWCHRPHPHQASRLSRLRRRPTRARATRGGSTPPPSRDSRRSPAGVSAGVAGRAAPRPRGRSRRSRRCPRRREPRSRSRRRPGSWSAAPPTPRTRGGPRRRRSCSGGRRSSPKRRSTPRTRRPPSCLCRGRAGSDRSTPARASGARRRQTRRSPGRAPRARGTTRGACSRDRTVIRRPRERQGGRDRPSGALSGRRVDRRAPVAMASPPRERDEAGADGAASPPPSLAARRRSPGRARSTRGAARR